MLDISLSTPSFRGAVLPLHLAVKVILNVLRGESKDEWGERELCECVRLQENVK